MVSGITLLPQHGPADYFLLLPQMCNYLSWFRQSPESYDPNACRDDACLQRVSNAAFALATVSHESYHVLGYRVEKQVECYGMQSIWFVATSSAPGRRRPADRGVLLADDLREAAGVDAGVLVGRVPGRRQVRPAPRQPRLAELKDRGAEAPLSYMAARSCERRCRAAERRPVALRATAHLMRISCSIGNASCGPVWILIPGYVNGSTMFMFRSANIRPARVRSSRPS
jgi:hypothetical protein